jgi:hypothetical protein
MDETENIVPDPVIVGPTPEVWAERLLRAELKACAVRAGMVDLDGLKMADLSTVKLNDDGSVDGGDALMQSLKAAKPYLFARANSGPSGEPPQPKKTTAKTAREMDHKEYQAAKKRLIAG